MDQFRAAFNAACDEHDVREVIDALIEECEARSNNKDLADDEIGWQEAASAFGRARDKAYPTTPKKASAG